MIDESLYGPINNFEDTFRMLLEDLPPGDIAEFGCFNGGATRQLARLAPNRTVYTFDTFSGMPTKEFNPLLDHDEPGKFKPEIPRNEMFAGYQNIIPVVGRFEETLPAFGPFWPLTKFALVYLDCDLYASTDQVLRWLPDHLTNPAAIVCDDYVWCRGAKLAIDEFLGRHGLEIGKVGLVIKWQR